MSVGGFLIDTHILLWDMTGSERLQNHHKDILESNSRLFISTASIWEIAIKASIRKLPMPDDLLAQIYSSNINVLPISPEHALEVSHLPHHHRDPFDRMLVVQAQMQNLTIMTMDKNIRLYDVNTI